MRAMVLTQEHQLELGEAVAHAARAGGSASSHGECGKRRVGRVGGG